MTTSPKKLDYIDALRGYAVLGVVCYHALLNEQNRYLNALLNVGPKGVQLFYVVSAFTLYLSFYNRQNEERPVQNFFIRRFFRIVPLFYVAILLYGLLYLFKAQTFSVFNFVAHVLLLHCVSPYWENSLVPGGWSVAVEVLFYLVCPFLFKRVNNANKGLLLYLVSFCLAQVIYTYMFLHPAITDIKLWNSFLYLDFFSQFPLFVLGIIAFYLAGSNSAGMVKTITILAVTYIIGLAIQHFTAPYHITLDLLNNLAAGIVFILVILVLGRKDIPLITNRLVRFLGKISYSMYLMHFAVIFILERCGVVYLSGNSYISYLLRLAIILLISSVVSYLTYISVELPMQQVGRNLIRRLNNSSDKQQVTS